MKHDPVAFDCIVMGDESLLVRCSELILERGHRIGLVITTNARIRAWAADRGLETRAPGGGLAAAVEGVTYDWFFSIGNLRMVPQAVWSRARRGAVNFHDGPLPRYAGLNAPVWAILAGERDFGISWHAIVAGVDEGDVYVQVPVEISSDDTALTLNSKCFEAGFAGFESVVAAIEANGLVGRPQNLAARTYFGRTQKPSAGATLDLRQSTQACLRLLRALDHGPGYVNPVAVPHLPTRRGGLLVGAYADATGAGAPGTVLSLSSDGAVVATQDGAIRVGELTDAQGQPVELTSVMAVGERLPLLDDDAAQALTDAFGAAATQEVLLRQRLAGHRDVELSQLTHPQGPPRPLGFALGAGADARDVAVAAAAAIARLADQQAFSVGLAGATAAAAARRFAGYFLPAVPLPVQWSDDDTVGSFAERLGRDWRETEAAGPAAADLPARYPALPRPTFSVAIAVGDEARDLLQEARIPVVVALTDAGVELVLDAARFADAAAFARRVGVVVDAVLASDPSLPLRAVPLVSAEERTLLLETFNATTVDHDRSACIHQAIERQVDATPDATAVVFADRSVTYAELDRLSNRVAHALIRRGVQPDDRVGIHLDRSIDLVVAVLGVLKAGAAYVPLDPKYPADRLRLMIEDSGARVVMTDGGLPSASGSVQPLAMRTVLDEAAGEGRPSTAVTADHLAYVIYTSGSTGRPKGVMLEHRNVLNFMVGMDERIARPRDRQPVWLAVTSLSFDISVLELLWTLARGFKVVVSGDPRGVDAPAAARRSPGAMDFSLFYWGNDDGPGRQKYDLLLQGARFADTHGFRAVWTPERHFHAFGGPYPNPSVTGAAVAAVTSNLDIRAGSCVSPLHHPIRVAEEWSVIDNISNGRAGLAFASGWMPEDFVLRPENAPPRNKEAMFRDIDTVRRLWAGEAVAFPGANGKTVEVVTQPRPVQASLPVWVTTAGNPETYREAARVGANVLTHLLGQSIDELAGKIRIYHDELRACGRDPANFTVTLMLHTLVGEDRDVVREQARGPLKSYLRSAAALIKQYAWAFPAFKKPAGAQQAFDIDLQTLEEDELDAILEFAFLRYFEDSGLFGTVADALDRVEQVKAIGVSEIACLIDFGVPKDIVLGSLTPLAEVVRQTNAVPVAAGSEQDYGIAAQIGRHGVTHLQCTPSMASMLLLDERAVAQLRSVEHLFLGGEALLAPLVAALRAATDASIDNMYGPTETTIWSSTHRVDGSESVVPLGTPIANTQLYVLDSGRQPLPPGYPGELYIGGEGVARGYLGRDELTAERFVPNPFRPGERMYRTGDLAQFDAQGRLQYLGRIDHQVKVRGYRIELGEIEAALGSHPGVKEAVVVAREDKPGDVRIVAYLRLNGGKVRDEELRALLLKSLPEFMVPAHFVTLESFPLTPNAKVDRKALPAPDAAAPRPAAKVEAAPVLRVAAEGVQAKIVEAFRRTLGLDHVAPTDNFFAVGGHSLLAVQLHRELKATIAPTLAIADLFRYPTAAGLAAHIGDAGKPDTQLARAADRAAQRRMALAGRGAAQR